VFPQESCKIFSFIQQNIISLISLHINVSYLLILLFLLISLTSMSHKIFRKPRRTSYHIFVEWRHPITFSLNGDKLYIMSCKLLIRIKPRALSNFTKENMLATVGFIRPSLTLIDLLIDTRHVLWLKDILKPSV